MAVAISAVEQDAYPPRVLVSVTGLTLGDQIDVYRVISSDRTLIRQGTNSAVTDTSFLVIDAELPFEVPVSYVAVVNGTTEYTAGPDTYHLEGFNDVLTDAITGDAVEALRRAQPEWETTNQASVFQVAGRNIVVSNGMGQYSTEIEFYTEAQSSAQSFKELLADATSGVVQLRDNLGNSDYLTILSYRERRYSQDKYDDRRFFILEAVQTASWPSALEARGFTLQDIADYYGVSGTLQDIDNDFTSLLDIAQGDFTV
jgi:hypothetical protein